MSLPLFPDLPEVRPLLKTGGYAARPGTGPKGEKCKTCRHHAVVEYTRSYHKCALISWRWSGCGATDIRVGSPACERWERK